MAKKWCLVPELAEKFKRGIQSGKIDVAKFSTMSPEARIEVLKEFVGENAAEVNFNFEKGLLLKDQDAATLRWLKDTMGIPDAKRIELAEKTRARMAAREERIFDPKDAQEVDGMMREQQTFLASVAEQALGAPITRAESKEMFRLSQIAAKAKENFDMVTGTWTNEADRLKYGAATVMMENYVTELKDEFHGMGAGEVVKTKAGEIASRIKERPVRGTAVTAGEAVKNLADLSIAVVGSWDDSFMGRQGIHILMTHPTIWAKAAANSIRDIVGTLGGKEMIDVLMTDALSRQNAMNGRYKTAGILDINEEQYPTSVTERIPIIGRVFKASEAAFKGTALRMRMDTFDLLADRFSELGIDMNDKYQLESLGKLVNSATAKGKFKKGTPTLLKALLWSPKMLKGTFDTLTAHTGQDMSSAAVKEAWKNLFKRIAITALVIAIANAIREDDVELNPLSSEFLLINGVDITGGAASMITFLSRQTLGATKSTTTGEITPYSAGFGKTSRFTAIINYLVNKTTPPVHVAIDVLKGEDFSGNAPTVAGELQSLYVPLSIQHAIGVILNPKDGDVTRSVADFFGFSDRTYTQPNIKTGIIPEDTKISNEDFISQVVIYATALGSDPETAFNRIFTGQRIRRVDNGAIIVERMPLKDSQEVKEERGGNNPQMKLDHTIPLQLGGSNDKDNLKLVTTSEWSSYTKIENHLGGLLRDGKISKDEAQKLIVDFKNGKIGAERILKME